jgi:hypothetical protein
MLQKIHDKRPKYAFRLLRERFDLFRQARDLAGDCIFLEDAFVASAAQLRLSQLHRGLGGCGIAGGDSFFDFAHGGADRAFARSVHGLAFGRLAGRFFGRFGIGHGGWSLAYFLGEARAYTERPAPSQCFSSFQAALAWSFVLEFGRPLLDKGRHTFFLVMGGEH